MIKTSIKNIPYETKVGSSVLFVFGVTSTVVVTAVVTFFYSTNHLLHLNARIARMIVDISMDILLTPEPKRDNVPYIRCIYSSTIFIKYTTSKV